jgi:uncharacterized protein YndB with AHSA1/START domain
MPSTPSTTTPPGVTDRELTLTRTFDAPRQLVYRAWTDPAHVANWWLPGPGFTVPVCEIDARPGGAFRVDMRGPDGMLYPNNGMFFEAAEPERIVFSTVLLDDASHAVIANLNTIAFEEQGDRTRISMQTRLVHVAPEASEAVAGMEEGWNNCLARFDERIAAIRAGTDAAPEDEQFVYTREFDAPRDIVFAAWTDAARLAKWFGPAGMDMLRCSIDLRPGGVFHYGMRGPDGQSMWGKWTFREIAAPGLLEFIVSFSDEQRGVTRHPMSDTWPLQVLSTIRFEDIGRRTRVTMTASPIGANETERRTFIENKGSMVQGWSGTAAQLDTYLKSV